MQIYLATIRELQKTTGKNGHLLFHAEVPRIVAKPARILYFAQK